MPNTELLISFFLASALFAHKWTQRIGGGLLVGWGINLATSQQ